MLGRFYIFLPIYIRKGITAVAVSCLAAAFCEGDSLWGRIAGMIRCVGWVHLNFLIPRLARKDAIGAKKVDFWA